MPAWGWNLLSLLLGSGVVTAIFRYWINKNAKIGEIRRQRNYLKEVRDDAMFGMVKRINHGIRQFQKRYAEAKESGESVPSWLNPSDWWNGVYTAGMEELLNAQDDLEKFDKEIVQNTQTEK